MLTFETSFFRSLPHLLRMLVRAIGSSKPISPCRWSGKHMHMFSIKKPGVWVNSSQAMAQIMTRTMTNASHWAKAGVSSILILLQFGFLSTVLIQPSSRCHTKMLGNSWHSLPRIPFPESSTPSRLQTYRRLVSLVCMHLLFLVRFAILITHDKTWRAFFAIFCDTSNVSSIKRKLVLQEPGMIGEDLRGGLET